MWIISIYGYPYMDIRKWILSIYGYPYINNIHIRYPYMDNIHIRISKYRVWPPFLGITLGKGINGTPPYIYIYIYIYIYTRRCLLRLRSTNSETIFFLGTCTASVVHKQLSTPLLALWTLERRSVRVC